jgi:hypothetical protein
MTDEERIGAIAMLSCISCGCDTGGMVGFWTPPDDVMRYEFGIEPPPCGFHWAYPVCLDCAQRTGEDDWFGRHIEDLIVARFRRAVGMVARGELRPRIYCPA